MINYSQFKKLVVVPTLRELNLPNQDRAASLLMKIAAWESEGCTYLMQHKGPALGLWQFEPGGGFAEVNRLWRAGKLPKAFVRWYTMDTMELAQRLDVAAAYARMLLWPDPAPLPTPQDWGNSFSYYVRVWRPGKPPSLPEFKRAHEGWVAG